MPNHFTPNKVQFANNSANFKKKSGKTNKGGFE